MWTSEYDELLLEWASLRNTASELPVDEALTLIHDWWHTAPIVNNTVHFTDPDNWPLPWDLLAQNGYCDVAKCLGICYTIMLIQHEDIKSLHMVQTANTTYVCIGAIGKEFVLCDEVGIITSTIDGKVLHRYDCAHLRDKF